MPTALVTSGAPETVSCDSYLPVLHAGDRRGWLRAGWSPFLPDVCWPASVRQPGGQAQVYLDASGSMFAEMGYLVALLRSLQQWIRTPFWAFSNEVAPARIEKGELVTDSTGGTSFNCVLEHVARTRPTCAVRPWSWSGWGTSAARSPGWRARSACA